MCGSARLWKRISTRSARRSLTSTSTTSSCRVLQQCPLADNQLVHDWREGCVEAPVTSTIPLGGVWLILQRCLIADYFNMSLFVL